MIAIIDYGVGNLFSLSASLKKLEIPTVITSDPKVIGEASHIILPGVGAFGDAAEILRQSGLDEVVREAAKDKPLLGICLGMQLLFEEGLEFGVHQGLGLIPGKVVPMEQAMTADLKIPHMGWNKLQFTRTSPLLSGITEGDGVYFVHSFYADTPEDYITSVADYSFPVTATVQKGNIFGTQFHPEKSGNVGLAILKAFYDYQ